MKYYAAFALLLVACQPDQPAATTKPATAAPSNAAEPSARPPADTLHVADSLGHPAGVLRLRPSTKAAFDQLRAADPLPQRPAEREEAAVASGQKAPANLDAPLPADGRVQRRGETLVFRPAQGPAVTLRPVPSSPDGPEGNDIGYAYWGSLPAAHQWVVDVTTDEGPAVLLLDQRTGRRTDLLGAPALSPDGRYLLSVCEDVASGGTPTEMSLYRVDGPIPQLVWNRALGDWGPRYARWRDARHVVLALAHAAPSGDVAEGAGLPLTYAELELPATR
ncbi:hypothetical protein [Hymenobacter ruricola]|uniref:S9 family peptidase n=1 Tax=Hymenobacter ruricola TaxID=2791023 RepID=A0ABS0I0G6_9BACT|nr:hypothetical protein [Hymenobacter ruricola]MBF9220451.1 hypothetical protein [Hymenobacter ruricola]